MSETATRPRPNGTCWVVTDGKAGVEGQCVGLAEALGYAPEVKRIQMRRPWRWMPPLAIHRPLARLCPAGARLAAPWPDVLIASGRRTVALSIAVRRASGGRVFTVQIQKPGVDPARFDAVVTPRHDRLRGANVIETVGSLNRVTPARLAAAARRFGPALTDLPRPLVAVMLGGNSKAYRMSAARMTRLGARLAELARRDGAGLLVTPSRRTPPRTVEIVRRALHGLPARTWDGQGENPYLAYLALADALVVTADSVNMVSEAATTGKPVFVVDLDGGSAKFARFHRALAEAGITRPFAGRLETWTYPPLNDTERAAAAIRRRLAAHGRAGAAPMSAPAPV